MTYIELINKMWTLREQGILSVKETDLFMYLLNKCNRLGWKNPFNQPTAIVCASLGISRHALTNSRNRLKQAGLIDFNEGTTKGKPAEYLICGVSGEKAYRKNERLCYSTDTQCDTQLVTQYNTQCDTQLVTQHDTIHKTKTITRQDKERVKEKVPDGTPFTPNEGKQKKTSQVDLFVEQFNAIRGTKFKPTDKVCRQFNARLKEGFTTEQMLDALKNAMQDDFHKGNGFKYLTPEFFTRSDKIDMFANRTIASETLSKNSLLDSLKQFKKERGMD